jgi:hypothetical protein
MIIGAFASFAVAALALVASKNIVQMTIRYRASKVRIRRVLTPVRAKTIADVSKNNLVVIGEQRHRGALL